MQRISLSTRRRISQSSRVSTAKGENRIYFTISEQFSHDYEQRYNNRIYERRFKSCYPPSRISMTLYHSVWKPFRAGKIAELTSKRWQRK